MTLRCLSLAILLLLLLLLQQFRCVSKVNQDFTKNKKWSYTYGLPRHPLMGITIGNQLQVQTEKHPDRIAAIFLQDGERLTFAELLHEVNGLEFICINE